MMKYIFTSVFLVCSLLTFGQVANKSLQPITFAQQLSTTNLPILDYRSPNLSALQAEDERLDGEKGRQRIGTMIPVNTNMLAAAEATQLSDGKMLYRLAVETKEAEALGFYFNAFELNEGDVFFVFNENGDEIQGGYEAINNTASFATGLIAGQRIILELLVRHPQDLPKVELGKIGYVYRQSGKKKQRDFGDSGFCQVNVNCSEGNGWDNQRDAVVRILIVEGNNQYWCTGTLMNNVRQDCTPYLLTAEHCAINATPNDINQWIFYFNYEPVGCATPPSEGSLASNFLTGATRKARSNDNGGDSGSDFMLLELNNSIPDAYNPYFAGWDANNTPASSGVSIHHPQGDVKKISTFTVPAVTTSFGGIAPSTHWGITWGNTANGHGVTETGSSGSPLFNQDKRVVGSLTGGTSFCNFTTGQDEYGKLSYHWESNSTNVAYHLKPWLDPDNTGTTVLDGIAQPCNTSTNNIPSTQTLKAYPNPAQQQITLEYSGAAYTGNLVIYDMLGKTVRAFQHLDLATPIDISYLHDGMYVFELQIDGEKWVTRVVVQR